MRLLSHSRAICRFHLTMSRSTIAKRRVCFTWLYIAPMMIMAPNNGGGRSVSVFTVAWCSTGICGEKFLKKI